MLLSDTSTEIREMQYEIWRSMSDEKRSSLAIEMSLIARDLLKAAIPLGHPGWFEPRVIRKILRLSLLPKSLRERF